MQDIVSTNGWLKPKKIKGDFMRNTQYRGQIARHSMDSEDSDKYQRYNDIEDEGYVRGGYARAQSHSEMVSIEQFDDRTFSKTEDLDAESYQGEDIRGRHDRH